MFMAILQAIPPALLGFMVLGLLSLSTRAAETINLKEALARGYRANPELQAFAAKAVGESSQIRSKYWLDTPRVGLMRESNMTLMQQQMGPMTSASLSQEIKFPVKYFLLGSAQSSRATAAEQDLLLKKLELRQKLVTAYFNVYATSRIVSLFEAQKETLREIARIAEVRRATGKVPQQDEMKAHVEQTKLENDLLMAKQEHEAVQANLNQLLNLDIDTDLKIAESELKAPVLKISLEKASELYNANSPMILKDVAMQDEATTNKGLAYLSFAPDFMLSYRKAISNAPSGAYAIGIEATFPLWFFMKETADVQMASAQATQAERTLEKTIRENQAELRTLLSKVRTQENLIKIYETSLIPQATTTLNSSRAAYQAGRTNFLELLDSERSVYSIKVAFYQTLTTYVETVTKLEQITGKSISSLPFGEIE